MLSSARVDSSDFHDLLLWHDCRRLLLMVYEVTAGFPETEIGGLTSQIRNGCVGITTDVAQALRRDNPFGMERFFNSGISKAEDLSSNLNRAKESGFLANSTYIRLVEEVEQIVKMLASFIRNNPMSSESFSKIF